MNRKELREIYNFTSALAHCAKGILDEELGMCRDCPYTYEPECKTLLYQNIDKYFRANVHQGLKDILEGIEEV